MHSAARDLIRYWIPSRDGAGRSPMGSGMVPLLYAALLFVGGIAATRLIYLRPGLLLAGLVMMGLAGVLAAFRAPGVRWVPIGALWLMLGFWSAEMERAPGTSPEVARLSDGLIRSVEGTVLDAGPVLAGQVGEVDGPGGGAGEQAGGRAGEGSSGEQSLGDEAIPGRQRQRVDIDLSAVEVVTDTSDTIEPFRVAGEARGKSTGEAHGETRVRLSIVWREGFERPIRCGQRLRVVVRMLPAEVFHDPGVWSRESYLEGQQISAAGSVDAARSDAGEPRLRVFDGGDHGNGGEAGSARCLLNGWRNRASERLAELPVLTRRLPAALRATPEDAAMLAALLTGDRSWLTRGIRVGFERTGSFHLIVVSGLHMAILAGCVGWLARRMGVPRWPAAAATMGITLAYALFTGFAIPAQRSFWMIALYLIGRLFYRDRSPLNAIGLATLCLAAVSPRSIFDASLQMTLLSVAAIAGVAMPLLENSLNAWAKASKNLEAVSLDPRLPRRIAQLRIGWRLMALRIEPWLGFWVAWRLWPWLIRAVLRVGELLFVTVVVEMALALPMAVYFHRITLYALPVNLLILPLLGLLVPVAMLLLVVLSTAPSLAVAPAALCLAILHFSVFVVRRLGALAMGDWRVPNPGAVQVGICFGLFVLALLAARSRGFRGRRAKGIQALSRGLAFAALLGMALVALWPRAIEHPEGAMLFEAIDVGQGDSLLLISPDGRTLLVDGGGVGFPSRPGRGAANTKPSYGDFDVAEEVVSATLWSRGIRRLDAVALSHAHHDHMGGLPAILRNFKPRELWVGNNPPVAAYTDLLAEAVRSGVTVRRLEEGDAFSLGRVSLRVLGPGRGYRPGREPKNDDSLVLRASYGDTSVLLEGDAEGPEERSMVNDWSGENRLGKSGLSQNAELAGAEVASTGLASTGLASTVLKVGHHGSVTSTHPEFLGSVRPGWAVISCGRRNRFGHPREEILAELEAAHVQTFRTDIDGATCLLLDGRSVHAQPMCAGAVW